MMKMQIVADSSCDIPESEQEMLGVKTVPLTLTLGEKSFTDDNALDLPAFMEEMKACKERVGSAAPAPSLYEEAFKSADASFAVTISANLSGSYSSAMVAKGLAEESGALVHVFDSKSASAGEALIVHKIRQLILAGVPRLDIVARIEQFINDMKTFFVLDNIDNLLKNGRLNRITGTIISKLHIRPILGADKNGDISLFSHVQGWKQAVKKLADTIESSGKTTDGETMVITHCNNTEMATMLADEIRQRYKFKEILVLATRGLSSVYANEKGIIIAF
jgi:DegV family protein with EDD domain